MPVGIDLCSTALNDIPDVASVLGINNFLFEDDEKPVPSRPSAKKESKGYLHMDTTNDKFPILVRRNGDSFMQLSASSAALDLALSQSPGPEVQQSNGWPSFARHPQEKHSMPMNPLRGSDETDEYEFGQDTGSGFQPPTKPASNNRRSMEVKFSSPYVESKRPG